MAKISVNPDNLYSGSNELNASGSNLGKISSGLGSMTTGLGGKYNGQLASQVNGIASQAQKTGTDIQNKLSELSKFLSRKGFDFNAVDSENDGAVSGITTRMSDLEFDSPVMSSSATLRASNSDTANRVWLLGGFNLGPLRNWITSLPPFSWLYTPKSVQPVIDIPMVDIVNENSNFINADIKLQTEIGKLDKNPHLIKVGEKVQVLEETQSPDGDKWVKIITANNKEGWIQKAFILNASIVSKTNISAENIRSGINETDQFYPRLGFDGSTLSDCTWYAAAAVKEESKGKINLDDSNKDWKSYPESTNNRGNVIGKGWGSAGKWASSADGLYGDYIKANLEPSERIVAGESDFSPKAGDVLCDTQMGHVAFVEQTWLSEDKSKIIIVVSEENAGYIKDGKILGVGSPVKSPSEAISIFDAETVKRYRRTIIFDNVAQSGNAPSISSGNIKFIHFNYD